MSTVTELRPSGHAQQVKTYPMSFFDLDTLAFAISTLDMGSSSEEVKAMADRCHAIIERAAGPDAYLIYPECA